MIGQDRIGHSSVVQDQLTTEELDARVMDGKTNARQKHHQDS